MSAPAGRAGSWAAELSLFVPAAVLALMAGRAAPPAPAAAATAAAAPRLLRVCADANATPAANAPGAGLDAAVAALVARELGAELRFAPAAGPCDVVMGVAAADGPLLATRPYHHSLALARDVAMGVRAGDAALHGMLDAALARRRPEVDSIVAAHGGRGVARP